MSHVLQTPPPSFHPHLVSTLTYPSPPLPCPLIYEHYLPSSVILDQHELLPLFPGSSLHIWGNQDPEAPLSALPPSNVKGGIRFQVLNQPGTVDVPVHLRYLPPSTSKETQDEERLIIKIEVAEPRIYYNSEGVGIRLDSRKGLLG
ncbi:hypothetical protein BT69DRAFT_220290 [Atractiella rhizophila]|nr:hypothetical protein BT69DRAFT_220290 [Atractiella rhizophila]